MVKGVIKVRTPAGIMYKFGRGLRVSEKQIMMIRKLFAKYDNDGSGEVSEEELGEFLGVSGTVRTAMFKALDKDHDGYITLDEMIREFLPGATVTDIRQILLHISEAEHRKNQATMAASQNATYSTMASLRSRLGIGGGSRARAEWVLTTQQLLYDAIRENDLEKLKEQIAAGADVNKSEKDKWTPLHRAALLRTCGPEIIQHLIDKGAMVNQPNDVNWTPLMIAASKDRTAVLKTFIANGADVDMKGPFGNTALHKACQKGAMDCAEALAASGASPNIKNDNGFTALQFLSADQKFNIEEKYKRYERKQAGETFEMEVVDETQTVIKKNNKGDIRDHGKSRRQQSPGRKDKEKQENPHQGIGEHMEMHVVEIASSKSKSKLPKPGK